MSNTARFAAVFVLMTLSAQSPLSAQSDRTTVEGSVVDSSGRVLIGADVFLRDMDSGLELHQVADNAGGFRFLARPGSYRVTATRSDFDRATHDLTLTQTGAVDLRLELSPAAVVTQVVVLSGSREQELAENSTIKVDVIPQRLLQDSGSETVRDVLSEEPGIVTRSGSSASRSETQIQGIDSRQSLILIDGLPPGRCQGHQVRSSKHGPPVGRPPRADRDRQGSVLGRLRF